MLILAVCMISATPLTSCGDNEDTTAGTGEMTGSYTDMAIFCGDKKKNVDLTVTSDTIYVEDFPVEEIARKITEHSFPGKTASSVTQTTLAAGYTAASMGGNIAVALYPKPAGFAMTVDGVRQEVDVRFMQATDGAFWPDSRRIAFTIKTKEVRLNGTRVKELGEITFVLNPASQHGTPGDGPANGK